MRFHWTTLENVPMALGWETSQWPSEDLKSLGNIVSYDIGWRVMGGDTIVKARIGRTTRFGALSGGWMGGLYVSRDF